MDNLKTPSTNNGETSNSATPDLQNPNHGESLNTHEPQNFFDDIDSSCSTPYVSAPSSPGRGSSTTATTHIAFFYSAPASPMHVSAFPSTMSSSSSSKLDASVSGSFEFEFSGRFASNGSANGGSSMSSADELFLNGQIRPMKLSTHLQRPQMLAPLIDLEDEDEIDTEPVRGRDLRLRDKSLRRRTRSLSPLRNTQFQWHHEVDDNANDEENVNEGNAKKTSEIGLAFTEESNKIEMLSAETTPSVSASSSRSSSAGRNSKRWVFLKDFLYRSKSEGRSNGKFWSSISFSPAKEKKPISKPENSSENVETQKVKPSGQVPNRRASSGKTLNGVGKRRPRPPSPHELHYTANRAQAEEMRKKTFLPYRQGLLGCLGFSSKGYGAMNGFARALNPVSSR